MSYVDDPAPWPGGQSFDLSCLEPGAGARRLKRTPRPIWVDVIRHGACWPSDKRATCPLFEIVRYCGLEVNAAPQDPDSHPRFMSSLARGLTVLRAFEGRATLSGSEAAEISQLSPSSAGRRLYAIERPPRSGKFCGDALVAAGLRPEVLIKRAPATCIKSGRLSAEVSR